MADDSLFAGPPVPLASPPKADDSMFAGPAEPIKQAPGMMQRLGKSALGFAAGVGEGLVGAEQMLPDLVPGVGHGATGRVIERLHSGVEDVPIAEETGQLAPLLVGGWEGAESLIPKAENYGKGFANWLKTSGSNIVRGSAKGATAGGTAGAATPVPSEDDKTVAREKLKSGIKGAEVGGAIGAGLETAGAVGDGAKKVVDIARGKPLETAFERLKRAASEGAERASDEALAKAGEIEPRLEATKGDVAGLETERSTMREQQADADAAADRVLKAVTAEPKMSAEKFGDVVRQESETVAKKYRDIREARAGLKDVFASASKEPDIDTSNIIKSIGEKEWNTTTGLERIKNELRTGENGQPAVTLEKAHSLKMELDDMWRTAKQRHVQFSEGKAGEEARIYDMLRTQLKDAAVAKYPKYGEGLEKFRIHSRPLDFLERRSALAPMLRRDPYSKEYLKAPGDVMGSLLKRAQAGDKTLGRLIQENPALKEQARQFFRDDMGEPTPKQFQAWLDKNKNALEQTGLLKEFSDIGASLKGAAVESERAGTAVTRMSAEIAAKNGDIKAAQKILDASGERGHKYSTLLTEVENAEKISDLASKAKEIFKARLDDGDITQEEYGQIIRKADELVKMKADRDYVKKIIITAATTAALLTPLSWYGYHVARVFTSAF